MYSFEVQYALPPEIPQVSRHCGCCLLEPLMCFPLSGWSRATPTAAPGSTLMNKRGSQAMDYSIFQRENPLRESNLPSVTVEGRNGLMKPLRHSETRSFPTFPPSISLLWWMVSCCSLRVHAVSIPCKSLGRQHWEVRNLSNALTFLRISICNHSMHQNAINCLGSNCPAIST